ncbi:hypothetical protein AI2799V1_2889 [Enterobacter cloacae]|uniref:hypothetical protein n=1 Tax=Enterobacter hormaechei TaxID=158836 RepID=UPI0012AB7ED2|nr:hypothetical protein [Enterobacter hormaechei]CAE7813280.1 hypothetical protein AI2799V1_2889 [Enterobacter cloacae]CAH3813871.1 hypothetical protein AI2799V1_2889 [Enterobacter cloacae]
MKNICVVGSLSSIFTHSYISSLISSGFNVVIINTSKKINYDKYKSCEVLNLNKVENSRMSIGSKSKLKDNYLFCYVYEIYLFFRSLLTSNSRVETFLEGKNPNQFIFFWGTSIRKEFYSIKKLYHKKNMRPQFILDVATYPIRDYASKKTPKFLLWFDMLYFNSFDKVLSHSKIMDRFLSNQLSVKEKIINRFICSFPESAYYTGKDSRKIESPRKIIFLGTLDGESSINNISSDVLQLANSGVEVYIQNSRDSNIEHPNVKTFEPFSFEEIIEGKLSKFCAGFDGVLVAYGPMSKLREDLTYPTRYALALLQNLPIFIQAGRFSSLMEITAKNMKNRIVYYSDIQEIVKFTLEIQDLSADTNDCMENKLKTLLDKDYVLK